MYKTVFSLITMNHENTCWICQHENYGQKLLTDMIGLLRGYSTAFNKWESEQLLIEAFGC